MEQLVVVHLSDLHIGNDVDFQLLEAVPTSLRRMPAFLNQRKNDPTFYVVSGDLTENGSADQLRLACSYLLSRCPMPVGGELSDPIGLDIGSPDKILLVPGNHDNWANHKTSLFAPAYSKSMTETHFGSAPWHQVWHSLNGGILMEIFGIDSNEGLLNAPIPTQAGEFSEEQLTRLEQLLEARNDQSRQGITVRVVTFHHGLAFNAGLNLASNRGDEIAQFIAAVGGQVLAANPPFVAFPLGYESRQQLISICARQKVNVFLTGHHHAFRHRPVPIDTGVGNVIHELQSSTLMKVPPRGEHRGFYVHQVVTDGSETRWNVWEFRWVQGRFRPTHDSPDESFVL